jgi:hypothetical protein
LENDDDVPPLEQTAGDDVPPLETAAPADGKDQEVDINLVLTQCPNVTREQAIAALERNNGDAVNTIMVSLFFIFYFFLSINKFLIFFF